MSYSRRNRRSGSRRDGAPRQSPRDLRRVEAVVRERLGTLLSYAGLDAVRIESNLEEGIVTVELRPAASEMTALPDATLGTWSNRVAAVEVLLEAEIIRAGLPSGVVLAVLEAADTSIGERDASAAVQQLARLVARTGRPCALGPMPSSERRRVHEAVGHVADVWSRSDGEGALRRLWIVPRTPVPSGSD